MSGRLMGMIKQMTNEEYHAESALGSSTIKLANDSLAKFKAQVDGKIPRKESDAFDLGTAAHSAVLEQDFKRYVKGPDCDKRNKEWKDFEAANPGVVCLKPDQYYAVKCMYDAFYAHKLASRITNNGLAEHSFFSEINGLYVKARPDYLVIEENGFYIADYKTAQSASTHSFQSAIADYGYHLSMAHYGRVVERELTLSMGKPMPMKEFYWIVQEKTAPYSIVIHRADDDCKARAFNRIDALYSKIAEAYKTDKWPAPYEDEILNIDLPNWLIKKESENE